MLSVLKHLNYEPWFAIAEFVDNSIQSYLANESKLKALHGPDFKLIVKITISGAGQGEIIISDNAAGIAIEDFPRAFRPAHVPIDRTGLSEFGMGMKSAACWFANSWTVRTKALGESVERTVRFDIDDIVENNRQKLSAETQQVTLASEHYTTVTLRRLHHPPKGRTVSKIKDHLASIYRVFLRKGILTLQYNDENLQYHPPKVLCAVPYSAVGKADNNTAPVEWRKEIELDFGQGQRVSGFVALREKASTTFAGFALFRRDRLIEGSHDNTYRPPQIFKHTTSYPYQRIFGELHLDGFDVSHTKDGFRWEEYEDEFLDLLKDEIQKAPLRLLDQAENFRTLPTKKTIEQLAIEATSVVATHIEEVVAPIIQDATSNPVEPAEIPAEITVDESLTSEKTVTIDDGKTIWIITLRTTVAPSDENWITLAKQESFETDWGTRNRRLTIELALAHPFSTKYIGSTNENIELFLQLASGICISLMLTQDLTGEPPQTVLHFLNDLLRGAISET